MDSNNSHTALTLSNSNNINKHHSSSNSSSSNNNINSIINSIR